MRHTRTLWQHGNYASRRRSLRKCHLVKSGRAASSVTRSQRMRLSDTPFVSANFDRPPPSSSPSGSARSATRPPKPYLHVRPHRPLARRPAPRLSPSKPSSSLLLMRPISSSPATPSRPARRRHRQALFAATSAEALAPHRPRRKRRGLLLPFPSTTAAGIGDFLTLLKKPSPTTAAGRLVTFESRFDRFRPHPAREHAGRRAENPIPTACSSDLGSHLLVDQALTPPPRAGRPHRQRPRRSGDETAIEERLHDITLHLPCAKR